MDLAWSKTDIIAVKELGEIVQLQYQSRYHASSTEYLNRLKIIIFLLKIVKINFHRN